MREKNGAAVETGERNSLGSERAAEGSANKKRTTMDGMVHRRRAGGIRRLLAPLAILRLLGIVVRPEHLLGRPR